MFFSGLFLFYLQIEDGEIYASINQKDGMVCFHDNPEKYNNPAMLHKIDQEVRKALPMLHSLGDHTGYWLSKWWFNISTFLNNNDFRNNLKCAVDITVYTPPKKVTVTWLHKYVHIL